MSFGAIFIFLGHTKFESQTMNYLTFSRILIFSMLICVLAGSCSSTRKLKKKCHDCPEFSQEKPLQKVPKTIHANI